MSQVTGTFVSLRSIVPQHILIKLYYALVYPHLNRNIIVWGAAPLSHLRCLRVVHTLEFPATEKYLS